MSSQIIIRVQSANHGTKRVSLDKGSLVQQFISKVKDEFTLQDGNYIVWLDRNKTKSLMPSKQKSSLSSMNIKHGDMVYLEILSSGEGSSSILNDGETSAKQSRLEETLSVVEDEVDQLMWKRNGQIEREKNDQLCRHGPLGKCFHCMPYEPYDEEYLAKLIPPIKFLSFHSYLRKLTGGVDKGKFVMLENVSCKIKAGCKEHPPWPGGICTKCQPNAVTLQRQKYRHVDFIQFENSSIVERFLDYWRTCGGQRIGFLYGKYDFHKDIPLGIRAVVSAIHEPAQISSKSSVELLDSKEEDIMVEKIANNLGLKKIGWIFTDLIPLNTTTGSVKHFRGNVNTHFLSAEECIMAAELQNQHPNPCRFASDGHFGSKFVTVVVSGDSSNQIHFDGYQVSDQCMGLVRDDCLIPTIDAPELGYIKESTNEQYVPDVFYKIKDEYGNEVTQLAQPLPVEYLLLDMAVAFPKEQAFTFFVSEAIRPFPIEHRDNFPEQQSFEAFQNYMAQFNKERYMLAFKDFHLLVFMATCDMLPLRDEMVDLIKALKTDDENLLHDWIKREGWSTVEQLMEANAPSPPANNYGNGHTGLTPPFSSLKPSNGSASIVGGGLYFNGSITNPSSNVGIGGSNNRPGRLPDNGNGGVVGTWSCQHCTFINQISNQSCEICNLPRN